MTGNLLATKLFVPRLRRELVSRQRLVHRLNDGLLADEDTFNRKLTLVSAPAGYGKTALISEWLHGREIRSRLNRNVAWLSLDADDNDPARFYAYLLAALETVEIKLGQETSAVLQSPGLPPSKALSQILINEIAVTDPPILLALDDYHHITSDHINNTVSELLEHQPRQLHLVIMSREDPPLSLSRLRGHGEMIEIRQADLRFTIEETTSFLNDVMALVLASEEITALDSRTEGWIVGLKLVALALKEPCSRHDKDEVKQIVSSFAGSSRFILDYLVEEVFRRQPEAIRTFLMQTAFLDQLSGQLCLAVTCREDSQDVLQSLETANLFIIPLDDQRQWYRYHHLFADLLRFRAQREGLDISNLHRRASNWYEANGYPDNAIKHVLAAQDWERAASLVDEISDQMLARGQIATFLRWIQILPQEIIIERPSLCDTVGWALALSGQLEAAEHYSEILEKYIGINQELEAAIIALRAFIARARHDVPQTISLSSKALSLLPSCDYHVRCVLGANLGVAYIYSGELATATEILRQAVQDAQHSENHHAAIVALSFIGQIAAAQGRLHEAADLQRQAIQLGLDKGTAPASARAHANLAALKIEWNELDSAHSNLRQSLELGKLVGDDHIQRDAYRLMATVQQWQGDTALVEESLTSARQLLRGRTISTSAKLAVALSHVDVALNNSDLAKAERWWHRIESIGLSSALILPDLLSNAGLYCPQLGLVRARLMLALGQREAAAKLLAECYQSAVDAGLGYSCVNARVLQAKAAQSTREAQAYLTDALTLALTEGYIYAFLESRRLLSDRMCLAISNNNPELGVYAAQLLTSFKDWVAQKPLAHADLSQYPQARFLVDPLTDRELEILQLLSQHRTNKEISQDMLISVNTVKTHLSHIYEKLDVHDRRTAVSRARELKLLP